MTIHRDLPKIDWPAVIKYDGDDELVYVQSEQAWLRDAAAMLYHHRGQDQLIDSSGEVFLLNPMDREIVIPVATNSRMTLDAFVKLVRIHASNTHRCCIEKINFRSIAEGIRLIDSMGES